MTSKKNHAAYVKSVMSGDSLVLRSLLSTEGKPPAERILALAYIQSPRLGNLRKPEDDEPYSVEAREYLRKLVIGKRVTFQVKYTTNSGREYGRLFTPENKDVAELLVANGWSKLNEQTRARLGKNNDQEESEESSIIQNLLHLEAVAESSKLGIWKVKGSKPMVRVVSSDDDNQEFLKENKGKSLNGVIEQVRDGSTYRAYVKIGNLFKLITLQLSGVKSPIVRTNIQGQPDLVEEYGLEAKNFAEVRLLQRDVKIIIEGSSGNGTLIGSIIHTAGNIAEFLVANGLAKVVDWSVAMVTGGPQKLRAAEISAKQKKLRIWKDYVPKKGNSDKSSFQATVIRVVNGDTLEVLDDQNKIMEFQFSSIKQPKISDPSIGGYAEESKEFLRKRLIGQKVTIKVDYHKPEQDGFKARDCATITKDGSNIAVDLVKKGLAQIIRHKQSDDQRSSCYDDLLEADHIASEKKLGVYSGKVITPINYTDISGQAARAKSILPHLTRTGKLQGIVEFVSQGSRFKIKIPRESMKITLVLGGLRCPRSGPDSKEPYGNEALLFSKKRVMQRDVSIAISSVDNSGGFIGSLSYNKGTDLGIDLLKNGLAHVHEYSASQMSNSNALFAAENQAKLSRVGIWTNYDPSSENSNDNDLASNDPNITSKPNIEFIDLYISEMLDASSFYIQIAKQETLDGLDKLMKDLSVSGKQSNSGVQKAPRNGEMVIAKFPSDNTWYRAKVKKVIAGRECELFAIDYGNVDTVPIENIRVIDPKLSSLPAVAVEAKLAFLKTPKGDYKDEAFSMVANSVQGIKLTANIEARTGGNNNQVLYLTLYDSSVQSKPDAAKTSINSDIVRSGYATVDKKNQATLRNPEAAHSLSELVLEAKKNRNGMWEYGDIDTDDEDTERN
ncbi:hypothetical protein AYI68_g2795 [Smittium mucronatum]|uniref:Uncharacterized protein n=1 Tax=Smittium mucronatum TaxID=133383 RepID=A0A1R0H1P9_9FUNG|nr:hypothetical protein AYI68_g2795 [Smittium mucronatum]